MNTTKSIRAKNLIIIVFFLLCFPKNLLSIMCPQSGQLKTSKGAYRYVATIVPNPKFLSEPDNSGIQQENAPGYREALKVYSISREEDYYLVKSNTSDNCCGWIPSEELITSTECMRENNTKNPAFLKVAVKNNWKTSDGRAKKSAPIYNGPGTHYKKIGAANLFEIRYAYKIKTIHTRNGKKQFIFIGGNSRWSSDYPGRDLNGWIEKQYCSLWYSRIGVYYNKENMNERSPVYIFRNQAELQEYLLEGIDPKTKAIAFEEDKMINLPHYVSRFPVLKTERCGNYDVLKIAFIGEGMHQLSGKIITQKDMDRKKNKLYQRIADLKKKDILFLIDATKSMTDYYQPVKNAVQSFVNNQNKIDKVKTRFALAVYRDYQDGDACFQLLESLHVPDKNKTLTSTYPKSSDTDYPEAVFNGIIKGIDSLQWENGIRAIIVIGDHGNHTNDSRVSIDRVVNKLKSNMISFYSINVNVQPNLIYYNNLFRDQMKTILSGNKHEGDNYILETGSGNDIQDTENSLYDMLLKISVHSENTSKALYDKIEGKSFSEIDSIYGTRVTNYLRTIMEREGLKEDQIDLSVWSQLCEEGWISKKSKDGKLQVKPDCLMSRLEADELYGFLAGLVRLADSEPRRVKQTIEQLVRRTSGDNLQKGETIAMYLRRQFHVPFNEVSKYLQYTPTKLQNKFLEDNQFKKSFNKNIAEKYERLKFVIESKIGKLDYQNGKWRRVSENKKEWWFVTKNEVSYAWLPMSYLP